MIEKVGDIFSQTDADAICFTSNGIVKSNNELVMGAGIAKAFRDRFPWLAKSVGYRVIGAGNQVHVFKHSSLNFWIASFPTKHHFKDPSDLALIEKSATELVFATDLNEWKKVYLTRPGCGLGGLDWRTQVRPLIASILDDRFIILSPK